MTSKKKVTKEQLEKVLSKFSAGDIKYAEKHGEFHAVKLTAQELEVLKGGIGLISSFFPNFCRIVDVLKGLPQV